MSSNSGQRLPMSSIPTETGRDQVIDLMVFGMGVNDSAFLKDNFTLHDRHIGYHSSCGTEQDSLIVTWRLRRGFLNCD